MVNLTKAQRNIFILSITIVIFLLCFWVFVYLPQKNKLSSIKKEITYIETQIAQINKMTGGRDLTEVATGYNTQLRDISAVFSFSEEELIDNLSKEAKNLNIEINSIKPLEKKAIEEKTHLKIEELPVNMQLSCEFRDLANYLKILKDNFHMLVKVRKIDIMGAGEGKDVLKVNLQISAYLSKGSR
jgi:hypothetical protein